MSNHLKSDTLNTILVFIRALSDQNKSDILNELDDPTSTPSIDSLKKLVAVNKIIDETLNFIFKDSKNIEFNFSHRHELTSMSLEALKQSGKAGSFLYSDLKAPFSEMIVHHIFCHLFRDTTLNSWIGYHDGLFQIKSVDCPCCKKRLEICYDYNNQCFCLKNDEKFLIDGKQVSCEEFPETYSFKIATPSKKLVIVTDFANMIPIKKRSDFFENSIGTPYGAIRENEHHMQEVNVAYLVSTGAFDYLTQKDDNTYLVSSEEKEGKNKLIEKGLWAIFLMDKLEFSALCKKNKMPMRDFNPIYINCNDSVSIDYDLNTEDFIIHI